MNHWYFASFADEYLYSIKVFATLIQDASVRNRYISTEYIYIPMEVKEYSALVYLKSDPYLCCGYHNALTIGFHLFI